MNRLSSRAGQKRESVSEASREGPGGEGEPGIEGEPVLMSRCARGTTHPTAGRTGLATVKTDQSEASPQIGD